MDRNVLAVRSGGHTKLYLVVGVLLVFVFSNLLWMCMEFMPYVLISVFNTCLGVLLIDLESLWYCIRYGGRYCIVFMIMLFISFFVDLPVVIVIGCLLYHIVYYQSTKSTNYL